MIKIHEFRMDKQKSVGLRQSKRTVSYEEVPDFDDDGESLSEVKICFSFMTGLFVSSFVPYK